MRRALLGGSGLIIAVLLVGCAGPERKFGRGVMNVTEFARMGELRRSIEQTYLWVAGSFFQRWCRAWHQPQHRSHVSGRIRNRDLSVASL